MNDMDQERREVEGHEGRDRPRSGRRALRWIFAVGGGLGLFAAGLLVFDFDLIRSWGEPADAPETATALFEPPSEADIPDGPAGDAIRLGMEIFKNTGTNASDHVGNSLSCANCHLDGGRRADSAPMWAAWVTYPLFRSKNNSMNTMEDRIKGCFTYSMNAQDSISGGPPPAGDDIYRNLQTYMHWLATGAATNVKPAGAGYPALELPEQGYDPARGEDVFQANCAACHGADGQGQQDANGRYTFPPLWGPQSYNWGAGMARVNTAAGFIKANMPLGQPGRLTDQQAWDVAAYLNSHERPKDPRQTGTVEEAAAKDHAGEETYYGKILNGVLLGTGTPRPSAPIGGTPAPAPVQ